MKIWSFEYNFLYFLQMTMVFLHKNNEDTPLPRPEKKLTTQQLSSEKSSLLEKSWVE